VKENFLPDVADCSPFVNGIISCAPNTCWVVKRTISSAADLLPLPGKTS